MASECCASGRCEVCRPSFFGNDTPTRNSKGEFIVANCAQCGVTIGSTNRGYRLPWAYFCSTCSKDMR